jgi:DNA-binding response OmpR family regulator
VRNVIATILRRAGHDVTVASDAQRALEAARATAKPFELLISDVVMPGMSGIELSRELLARSPTLRVLLLSGYPGRDARQGDERGMDYLAKPVTPKELLDRVDQLLGST